MSDIENIKWSVSRIDMFHDVFGEQISDMEMRYERYSETFSSQLREKRNYILSGIGICLTILFGYTATYSLEQWLFHTILGILSAIGFLSIIFISWVTGQVENLFSDLSTIARNQHIILLKSKGTITMSVAKLENVNYNYVENYLVFVMLLTASIMLQFSKDFHELSKKYFYIRDFKQSLEKESKQYKDGVNEQQIILGLSMINRQNIPPDLLEIVDKTLKKYAKKRETSEGHA